MAIINITPALDALGGTTTATGTITATVYRNGSPAVRIAGETVTIPQTVTVAFTDSVLAAPFELLAVPNDCYWKVVIDGAGLTTLTVYVRLADGLPEYDFDELVFIDPLTLEPVPFPSTTTAVDYIQFNTATTSEADTAGKITWNATERTLDVGVGNSVTMQVGHELYFRVKAQGAISNGQPVMAVDVAGENIIGAPAIADGTYPSSFIIGVATEDIANNGFGLVTWFGQVRSIPLGSFTEGDILYVSDTVPGGLTTTAPTQAIEVGIVLKATANGNLLVRPSW